MSPQCEVPEVGDRVAAPLPNLTALLAERKVIRILAIGSSSTSGIGSPRRARAPIRRSSATFWSARLKGVDVEVINRGVGGEVAATTAERLRSEVAIARPDLVLWQLGTNDALARVPVEEFDKTVRSTIVWLRENKIDVVLVGLQYSPRFARDDNYIAIRDDLFKIASEENILYVRRYNAMQFIEKARNARSGVRRRPSPQRSRLPLHGRACRAGGDRQSLRAALPTRDELSETGMKTAARKTASPDGPSASRLIDARIAELADWRGAMLGRIRDLIRRADPGVIEEWKWRGVPVWSHDGIICTGETYKAVVKMTFAKGAALDDPSGLFNASLDGNVRRAIDIREGETIDEEALKTLVRAAVALNGSKTRSRSKS